MKTILSGGSRLEKRRREQGLSRSTLGKSQRWGGPTGIKSLGRYFFKVQSPVVPDDIHFFCKNTLNTSYMPARCWESKTDVGPALQGLELENETEK